MSTTARTIDPEHQMLGEVEMVGRDRWEEIRRRAGAGASIRAIARELDVDRKTVRRLLRQKQWKPYQRTARADTLLASHAAYLRRRAAEVGYSAQVLFQELRRRQYGGSYETVKRFVRPLREMQLHAAVTRTRFETPPGLQSQIDWSQARVWLGAQREVRHIFVLTLGFSRRSVYVPCLSETLGELLDAHEQAFTHFGGYTQEHLYDRPRTVCVPRGTDGVRWNTTFKAFADFWGFEPRLCRPYRAQTKGKVESGVKYLKRNFLAGRAFRLEAPLTRVVATDYLVTVDTNRYSVPFTLIGQPVEVRRRDGHLEMRRRGEVVATHPVLGGRHQFRILPEHGPGAIARNARLRYSTGGRSTGAVPLDVEIRDLACYEAACGLGVRNDVAADDPARRAPAAAAALRGARAARSPAPGSGGAGALLCRLPRPATSPRSTASRSRSSASATSSSTGRTSCCSARRVSARRIWPSVSGARRSSTATACSSRRPRRC